MTGGYVPSVEQEVSLQQIVTKKLDSNLKNLKIRPPLMHTQDI